MNRVKWLLLGVAAFVFTGPSMFALDTSSFTPPPIKPPSPQQMAGGYWRTEGSFRPILRITNYLVNQTLLVTPVLYMADGTEYDLTPITLPAAETTGVDIIDALNKMPASLRSHVSEYGSAGVKYMWSWSNALTAMVQNLDVPRSLNFNFVLHTPMNMPGTPVSSQAVVREGMWWREDDGVEGFVAISNLSERTLSIRVQVRPSGIAAVGTVQDVQLGPHQTARLQLDFGEGKTGGVRITYKGFEHDVVLAGGLENDSEGYSAQIPFVLVDNTTAATDIGVGSTGLMNGAPDPMMMFPDGTIFHMYFALRNISSLTVAVTPTLYYMAGGTAKSVTLANLLLPAGQTRLLNGDDLLHKAGLDGLSGSLNVVFAYHSRPTDVLIATGSLDQSKTYVFEVEPQRLGTGSSRLLGDWSVADGNDTMISLLNPASRAHDISLTLYFAGGKYVLSLHLAPGESKMFNVSEIIMMSQSSGSNQPAIPAMITQGSAQMFGQAETNPGLGVIVSIAVFNVRTATCGNHCPNCFGYTGDVYISCLNCVVGIGQTATFADYALGQNGIWLNITNGSDWGATAWSVVSGNVTKTGFGTFLANSAGDFSVGAYTTVNDYPNDCPQGSRGLCPSIPLVPPNGTGTTLLVTISIRTSGTAASDNSARDAYAASTGTYSLGNFVGTGGYCSIGFEASGTLTPSHYTGTVILVRTKSGADYNGTSGQTPWHTYGPPGCPSSTGGCDTSNPIFEDSNPHSGTSNGVVYDLDAPGQSPLTNDIDRKRANFFENAQLPNGVYVGNEVGFYVRFSCVWRSGGNIFGTDVVGDNVLGLGSTKTTWNLQ